MMLDMFYKALNGKKISEVEQPQFPTKRHFDYNVRLSDVSAQLQLWLMQHCFPGDASRILDRRGVEHPDGQVPNLWQLMAADLYSKTDKRNHFFIFTNTKMQPSEDVRKFLKRLERLRFSFSEMASASGKVDLYDRFIDAKPEKLRGLAIGLGNQPMRKMVTAFSGM